MIYLEITDFNPLIKAENLTAIIDGDTSVLDTVELNAIATITTYLHELYDTEIVFSRTGTARDSIVIDMLCKLVLYQLYARLPKSKVSEQREQDKNDVMTILERVCDAKQSLPLPKKETEGIKRTQVRTGYSRRRTL